MLSFYTTCLLTGVAVGPELCGPESPPIRDPNIWVVTVGEYVVKDVWDSNIYLDSPQLLKLWCLHICFIQEC